MVATTHTVSLHGAVGHVVDVQVDLSHGLIATALVGRPDASIVEARDRCRAAVNNSGYDWPTTRRVTVLLSPADLPKRGPHFDLAIAVAVLAAARKDFPHASLEGAAMIGELTLDGRVRCVPGVLPMTMAAAARGVGTVYVPEPQAAEAALVAGVRVFGIRSLAQAMALLEGAEEVPEAPPVEPLSGTPLLSWRGEERLDDLDMADVLGMADTRYAVEVAAAGGHHLMLTGPKGSGKTTLAERIPGLLPDLSDEESLELTAVHSLCGTLVPGAARILRPPYRAPHHSASRTGILGGGTGRVRPGEVSKAHLGVLFLDEFPLFPLDVVEALREPLESGEISISRGEEDATYPARAMFVFACNPCPCGAYHPLSRDHDCTCSELKRRDYRRKISGPIADRIDITRFVEPLHPGERPLPFERPESSAVHAGPGDGRPRPPEPALRRPALAAQRPGTGAGAARVLAAQRRRRSLARRARALRAALAPRRRAGAPGGVVGGRPGRARPSRGGRARRGPAVAHRRAVAALQPAVGGERGERVSAAEEERLARVALSRIGEPGDPRLADLVHELDGRTVLAGLRRQASDRELGDDLAERLAGVDPARELTRASEAGLRFVVPGDEEWPAPLDDLASAPHLHERGGVPLGLWCRGPLRLDEAAAQAVGRRRVPVGHDVRRPGGGRDRRRPGRGVVDRRLGRGLRDRPGRASWCAVSPGADGRRPRVRRRPGLPGRAPGADRLRRRRGPRGLGGRAGVRAHAHPVPGPQPADRRPRPGDGGRRGRGAQRGAQHGQLGRWPGTHRDGGARPGDERAVGRGAPAGTGPRRAARDLGGGGPRGGGADRGATSWPTPGLPSGRETGSRRVSDRCSTPSRLCAPRTPGR